MSDRFDKLTEVRAAGTTGHVSAVASRTWFRCRRHLDFIAVIAIGTICSCIVARYAPQFSYLPDDGAYAHVASQLLAGAVLNLDVQDVHAGYVNFANALSMFVFGESLFGMRLLLAALTVIQACIVYWLLRTEGFAAALLSALTFACLTLVQFLNPTAHWYCLFLIVLLAAVSWNKHVFSNSRLIAMGALVGSIFLFRQLTGAIAAIATLAVIFLNARPSREATDSWIAKSLWLSLHLLIVVYVAPRTDGFELVIFGFGPVAVGYHVLRYRQISLYEFRRVAAGLGTGFLCAAAPLVAYHLWHGSTTFWIRDSFSTALSLSNLDFVLTPRYFDVFVAALEKLVSAEDLTVLLNASFWMLMTLWPLLCGVVVLKTLRFGPNGTLIPSIAVFATYCALISMHYQIPIYLFYSTSLTIVAVLAMAARLKVRYRVMLSTLILFCIAIGTHFHAGQPLSRGWDGTITGQRVAQETRCKNPKIRLQLERSACIEIDHLVDVIEANSASSDTILALPSNAELNFLSNRRSPVRFFNSALGVTTEKEYAEALNALRTSPPTLIFYRPSDKYNSHFSRLLIEQLSEEYTVIEQFRGFRIYAKVQNGRRSG